jgi:hypothetical protein
VNIQLAITLPLSLAVFGVIANHAREMYRDGKYREMFGALFWAIVPLSLFCLFWVCNEGPSAMLRNISLGLLGAAAGACALIWIGYYVHGPAEAQTGGAQTTTPGGGSVGNSTNQQGGITGGTVIINPAPSPNRAAINAVVQMVEEGEQIAHTFEMGNDPALIKSQYENWFAKTDQTLRTTLDAGYAAQFRNAPSVVYVRTGMNLAGAGYWQRLQGQLTLLNTTISELRR